MGAYGRLRLCVLLAGALLASAAGAQHGGPPGGGAVGGGMPGGHTMGSGAAGGLPGAGGAFSHSRSDSLPGAAPESAGTVGAVRGGLQFGPPGRWWDDKRFAKDLRLRPDQQHRMDAIFEANRAGLQRRLQDLEQEQNRMGALTHTRVLDEPALLAEIDRMAVAHAELEKANTHYLLQIRAEMDTEQIARLEQHH